MNNISIIVGDGLEVDLNNLNNVSLSSVEKIRELIEQDILFSNIENVSRILVAENEKETNSFYNNEINPGISFFHVVDNINFHVRIS